MAFCPFICATEITLHTDLYQGNSFARLASTIQNIPVLFLVLAASQLDLGTELLHEELHHPLITVHQFFWTSC